MVNYLDFNEITKVDINGDMKDIHAIFAEETDKTIFVIDKDRYLYGIITFGDFIRKANDANNIAELMNIDYTKIKQTFQGDTHHIYLLIKYLLKI